MNLNRPRLLDLAARAAAQACAALIAHRAEWSAVEDEIGREVKYNADRHAEALIIAALEAETPYRILSEEIGWVGADDSEAYWAVDPLDGSVNYGQGFPHWAVSIALVERGRPVLGVVDCPALNETFAGVVGEGATLNGAPIRVSAVDDPARGILMTGLPSGAATDPAAMADFSARIVRFRKVRMIGSAACALAAVGAGRAEHYHETGGKLWDVAAGCAIVEAAGGVVRIEGDRPDAGLDVRAGNGVVRGV
jgi:myo-inositol-1(or 4)-monophosphatase